MPFMADHTLVSSPQASGVRGSEDGNVVSATAAEQTRPTLSRVLTVLAVKTNLSSTGRFQIFTRVQKSVRA